ncbi:MAG: HAMP domain-containing histidine kinase, partial [Chloroflexi bacterium]|nr:HAMP domain-containing histidine kinase [Chloroflexota bacterium]
ADLSYLKEEIPAAVSQTLDGVQRVTKIVRAMKDFAHSDQGSKSMVAINEMLESTLTVARNELKYVADVETDFDPELPQIECHRDDLNQVFLNLLVNAAHAIVDVIGDSPENKGTITVATSREGNNIAIRISDTGSGISKEIQHRIFDQFFTTKDVGKGSGQGLAIARAIITEKHQGELTFETEEGKGTTFIIRLPITTPELVEAP